MIRTFFGSPGCGKTTLAVKMAIKNKRRYDHRYCNFENTAPGVGCCDLHQLGNWTFPPNSYIAVDEAGIDFNSRAHKDLPKPTIAWFKLHRHYRCDLDVLSQSWDDMDITIRRLSNELWYIYRFGPWSLARRVYKRVTVDKNTEQIIDGYKMASMLWLLVWPLQLGWPFLPKLKLTFRPFYYRFFSSWSTPPTVIRDFPVYERKHKEKNYFVAFVAWVKSTWAKVCASALSLYFKLTKERS